jgi:hypothetical protein
MNLENIEGNLLQAYQQCQPGTMRCADQLTKERRKNLELRDLGFDTADGKVYSLDNGVPTLRMTREEVNPVLMNIDDAFKQLTTKGYYRVLLADFEAVKAAEDTVTIDLTKLRLKSNGNQVFYLAISIRNKGYDKLNSEERKLAEGVYGQGTDFIKNMMMLDELRIPETKIDVLSPPYVQEQAKEGGAIARASRLCHFIPESYFNPFVNPISYHSRVRAVRRASISEPVRAEHRN